MDGRVVGDEIPWWRDGVLYQVYLRSFADSDGDGVGDLAGVVDRLDHLQWLGVDAVWLSPFTCSPNADWGYDVSDYQAVDPELGTSDDLDRLIAEADRRHLRVVMDLVPNHTSDRHPWFLDALSSRTSAHRDGMSGPTPVPTAAPPITGSRASAARPGPSTPARGSTTCTTTSASSPTSTGGTTMSGRSSRGSWSSGWTGG